MEGRANEKNGRKSPPFSKWQKSREKMTTHLGGRSKLDGGAKKFDGGETGDGKVTRGEISQHAEEKPRRRANVALRLGENKVY